MYSEQAAGSTGEEDEAGPESGEAGLGGGKTYNKVSRWQNVE